jgi:CubicO group peptidase (beta-lactamase class C family)
VCVQPREKELSVPNQVNARRLLTSYTLALGMVFVGGHIALADEAYPHAKEPIGTLDNIYDGALTPDIRVNTLRNIDRLLPVRIAPRSDNPYPLPVSRVQLTNVKFTYQDKPYDLFDYLALNNINGLIVLKNGQVVYETYQRGNTAKTRWMSFSVAKSITTTLLGAAVKEGYIASIDDLVVKYVPSLANSAYASVTIRQILTMTSGVKWDETYTKPTSDLRRLVRARAEQKPNAAMELMAKLPRAAEPGTVNNYSTGETQVAGEIVYRAVGKPLTSYLSERIWSKFGMESDAAWWLGSPDGVEVGGSGFSATLRDYARFGLFFAAGGKVGNEQILPDNWVQEASTPKTMPDGKPLDYGYMWWPAWTEASKADGAYAAAGIHGQYIYINPTHNIVIVQNASEPKPEGKAPVDPIAFFDAVVDALKK